MCACQFEPLFVDDVAKAFDVSCATVRKWIKAGKIKAQKVGVSYEIDPVSAFGTNRYGYISSVYDECPVCSKDLDVTRYGLACVDGDGNNLRILGHRFPGDYCPFCGARLIPDDYS